MRSKTACFTGHRELYHSRTEIYESTKRSVEELIQKGYCYFGAGGARGFDTLAAQAVLELKSQYTHIHLILVLPFQKQYEKESQWSADDIAEYHRLQEQASKVVILSNSYERGIYYKRNRHLVDASSACIAYLIKPTGGTAYTVEYANKQGVQVINLLAEKSENGSETGAKES